jgi:hypothetical protein
MRALPTLVEDLFDVVGWPYDGVDYVVLDDVRETMLDPAKSDHPLPTVGVVAQTPCDVAANLNLHSGLAEVDIAVVAQLKAHHVLHDPVKPLRIADQKVRRSEAIREVGEDGARRASLLLDFRTFQVCPMDLPARRVAG